MVPSAAAGINAVGDIMAVLRQRMYGGTGIDGAEMEGGGKAGTAGGGGTGMVEPGSVDMKDVAVERTASAMARPAVRCRRGRGKADTVVDADRCGRSDRAAGCQVEMTGTVGLPGEICPVGVEQVTTFPVWWGSKPAAPGPASYPACPAGLSPRTDRGH